MNNISCFFFIHLSIFFIIRNIADQMRFFRFRGNGFLAANFGPRNKLETGYASLDTPANWIEIHITQARSIRRDTHPHPRVRMRRYKRIYGFEATEKCHTPPDTLSIKLTPNSGAPRRVTNNRKKKRKMYWCTAKLNARARRFRWTSNFWKALLSNPSFPSLNLSHVRPRCNRPRARVNSSVK